MKENIQQRTKENPNRTDFGFCVEEETAELLRIDT